MIRVSSPSAPALAFTPVPLRARRDGWTAERQHAFIAALAETRCVAEACRSVGVSTQSAYALYRRPGAESFRAAFDSARSGTPAAGASPSTSGVPAWSLTGMLAALAPAQAAPRSRQARASTSAPPTETNGSCRSRRVHQLPEAHEPYNHQLPPPPPTALPTPRSGAGYSLDAFVRAARAGGFRRGPAGPPPPSG
jgi:hypothetical protein